MAYVIRHFFWVLLLQSVVVSLPAQDARVLNLEAAKQLFLSHSPEVEAERQQIEMARGTVQQAGMFPNPQLNYSQEGFPLGTKDASFSGDQEFLFWGTQKLELGGKRGHRNEAAQFNLLVASNEFDDWFRIRVAQLKETFARAYFAQKKRDLTRQHLELYREIRDIHRNRYEAGDVSGLSQLRLDLEEIRFLSAVNQAETDFTSAWTQLAAFIGWADTDLPRLEMPPRAFPDIGVEQLKDTAFHSRPDLRAMSSRKREMEERVALEESRKIPDLTVGGGYKRDFGVNSFFAGFQLPIPVFDRNQGAIHRTRAQLRRSENQYLWKEIQVGAEVKRAYDVYRGQESHVEDVEADLLDRAQRVVDITRQSYGEGEVTLTDYLDSLRVKLDTSLTYYDLLFQLHRAHIGLEKATGTELQ